MPKAGIAPDSEGNPGNISSVFLIASNYTIKDVDYQLPDTAVKCGFVLHTGAYEQECRIHTGR